MASTIPDRSEPRVSGKGQGVRQGALACSDPGIPGSDTRRTHPNENLILPWCRRFNIIQDNHLRRTEAMTRQALVDE
jgi:hypothetical protein